MGKLNFTATSSIFGDETQCFNVSFSGNMTLDNFIKAVLSENPGEWGSIYYKSFVQKVIEYKHGNIIYKSENYDSIKDNSISLVSSNGGWSLMNYIIDKQ